MDLGLLIEAKKLVLKILKQHDIKPDGNTTEDVLRSYFNLKHKVIKSKPRSVTISKGLLAKAKSLNVETVLVTIESKFISGEDVNPFLSKSIFRSESHDHLLNDWQIHHLHLNTRKKKPTDYFNARSELLLFVHLTDDIVYFIDIRRHNENYVFAQRDLLRIVRDNWPDVNKKFMVSDEEMNVYPKLDEEGITKLRKKGYMFYTQADGYSYAPNLGSAVSGFSMLAGLQMNEFHRELYKIHSYINEHEAELIELLSKNSGINLSSLNFTLAFKDWIFYVYEVNSGQFVNFNLTGYNPYAKNEKSAD